MEPVRIAVSGVGACSGTTTLATSLALWINENFPTDTAMVDLSFLTHSNCKGSLHEQGKCRESTFSAFAFDKRIGSEKYTDPFSENRINLRNVRNIYKGVNWILPREYGDVEDGRERIHSYIISEFGNVIVYDLGRCKDSKKFLYDMDVILGVIDPLPSKLINSMDDLRILLDFKSSGSNMLMVVNKMNNGVGKRQLHRLLEGGNIGYLPYFSPEKIYSLDAVCDLVYFDKDIGEILRKFFSAKLPLKVGI